MNFLILFATLLSSCIGMTTCVGEVRPPISASPIPGTDLYEGKYYRIGFPGSNFSALTIDYAYSARGEEFKFAKVVDQNWKADNYGRGGPYFLDGLWFIQKDASGAYELHLASDPTKVLSVPTKALVPYPGTPIDFYLLLATPEKAKDSTWQFVKENNDQYSLLNTGQNAFAEVTKGSYTNSRPKYVRISADETKLKFIPEEQL